MDIFDRFATDEKKETGGTWKQLDDTTSLLIARWGTKSAVRFHRDLITKHSEALASANPDVVEETNTANLIETMANKILIGWKGITFKGEPLEYTVENARMLLKLNDFRDLVWQLSNNAENYRYDKEAALEKNS